MRSDHMFARREELDINPPPPHVVFVINVNIRKREREMERGSKYDVSLASTQILWLLAHAKCIVKGAVCSFGGGKKRNLNQKEKDLH